MGSVYAFVSASMPGIVQNDATRREVTAQVELSYEAKKARFEERCFKTKGGKLPFHTILETGELYSESKEAFTVSYEDWIRDGRQFLGLWFADPTKRCYKNIEYSCVRKEDRLISVYYAFPGDPTRDAGVLV